MSSFPLVRQTAALVVAGVVLLLSACEGEVHEADVATSAKSAMSERRYEAAAVELKSALQTLPESGQLRFLLGQALYRQGEAANAVVEFRKALDLAYDKDQVVPALAWAMLARAQARQVVEQFDKVALTKPEAVAELQAALASAQYVQGNFSRGKEMVQAALAADPKNITARLMKVRQTAGSGGFDEALTAVQGVLTEAPGHAAALTLKAELLAAGKQDRTGAIKVYREAVAAEPNNTAAQSGLIELLALSNDTAAFRTQVIELGKAAPNSVEAHFYLAELALLDGDVKGARETAQKLLNAAPNLAPALMLAGSISLRSNELAQAQTQLEQSIQLAPNVPYAKRLLAEAQLRSGQAGRALATLKPLLEGGSPTGADLSLAAEVYLLQGDLLRAESLYTQAAKLNPDDTKSRAALALSQIGRGDTAGGFAQLEALAVSDKSTMADMALIAARLQRNDLEPALAAVARLETKQPGKSLPHLMRARILMQRNDRPGARASLEKALSIDPANFQAAVELMNFDVAEGRPDLALQRFEAVEAKLPESPLPALAVVEMKSRAGQPPEEVEAQLSRLVQRFPTDTAVRRALVEHHLSKRNPSSAVAAAQDAVSAIPNSPVLMDTLARAQLGAGDVRAAVATLQKAAAMQPDSPQARMRLAEVYIGLKDYNGAAQSLQRALDASPRYLPAQQGQVQLALLRKQVPEALKIARDVQKQRPNEAVGHLIEANVHASQRAWPAAIDAYKAALDRQPSSQTAVQVHSLMLTAKRQADADRFADTWERNYPADFEFISHRATVAAENKDLVSAERRYRQVLTKYPDSPQALNNVAVVLLLQHKPGALPMAERAAKLAPNQAAYLDTLATAQASEKKLAEALASQQRAVSLAPASAGYRLNLAKLLLESGKRAQAKTELEKLNELGAGFPARDEVVAMLKGL